MNYFFTETQEEIIKLAKEIADKKLKPLRAECDEKQELPAQILEEYRAAGLFGLFYPEAYGGLGGGVTELSLAVETLSQACMGLAMPVASTALGAMPLIMWGSAGQREKWCPSLASGEKLAAFALTEAESGSDATSIKTTAVKEGDYYIVNGSKCFISSGKDSDIFTVAVSTNPARGARGISLLVLEKGMEGFTFGKKEDKMGVRANGTYELVFNNVKVPAANIIGGEGKGLLIVQETLDHSRPGVAAQALGVARGALNETMPYLRSRRQFGQPVASFQALQHIIADLFTKLEAGRALVYMLARSIDEALVPAMKAAAENGTTVHDEVKKLKPARFTKESAMVKLFCSDTAMEVADKCVSLCGGIGYMKDFPVEKYMRDAKLLQIYEGTNHIQRNEIAANVIKEYASAGA